jgi:hypothetical protein
MNGTTTTDTRGTHRLSSDLDTLVWLRGRELRAGRKAWTVVASIVGWFAAASVVVLVVGFGVSVGIDQLGTEQLKTLMGPLWLLLAVGPALGGASAETATIGRLGALPVSPRALFLSSWSSAAIDVPYLVATPLVVGIGAGIGGVMGGLAAVGFLVAASAVGQMGAWAWLVYASGRRHPGRWVLIAVSSVVAVVAVAALAGLDVSVLRTIALYPGRQLVDVAGGTGVASAVVAMTVVLATACAAGGPLVETARRREAGGEGPAAPKRRGWSTTSLEGAWSSSLRRAVAVQVTFVTLAITPALPALLGATTSGMQVLGDVVTISLVAILGVNLWSFAGGGITMLLSAPVAARRHVTAMVIALGVPLVVGQLAVTIAAALVGLRGDVVSVFAAITARTALLCAWSVWFSTLHPGVADWDSLRVRPAPPGVALRFALGGAFLLGLYALGRDSVNPVAATLLALAVSGTLGWAASRRAGKRREDLLAVAG